jgi:hypothetical protein
VLQEHVRKRIGTGFEANAKEQIGVMLSQFLVHEGTRNWFGRPPSKRQAGQPDTWIRLVVARGRDCRIRCVRSATRRLPTCADRGVIRYVPRCRATRVARFDSDVLNGDGRVFPF